MSRLRGLTILLVEDDVDNLELLSSYLEGEGADTLSAGSIAGALALGIGHRIDIVLSDLDLPDGNGCALLEQVHRLEGQRRVPAIAVTGYSQEKWQKAARECGFMRFAVKPFSLERLVDWIVELTRGGGESVKTSEP
jgi:two-component system CheB/CheR fusion protein